MGRLLPTFRVHGIQYSDQTCLHHSLLHWVLLHHCSRWNLQSRWISSCIPLCQLNYCADRNNFPSSDQSWGKKVNHATMRLVKVMPRLVEEGGGMDTTAIAGIKACLENSKEKSKKMNSTHSTTPVHMMRRNSTSHSKISPNTFR